MADSLGMMNPAWNVSKNEILRWINDTLLLGVAKIEQLGTGAVYCQLFDSIYPGVLPMSKVNWKAKAEPGYVANYKLLQQGFDKTSHKKHIEVTKLVRCKYQDNLEFAQWFHAMWKMHGGEGQTYDPEERRGNIKIEEFFGKHSGAKGGSGTHQAKPKLSAHPKAAPATGAKKESTSHSKELKELQEAQANLGKIHEIVTQQAENNVHPGFLINEIRQIFGLQALPYQINPEPVEQPPIENEEEINLEEAN